MVIPKRLEKLLLVSETKKMFNEKLKVFILIIFIAVAGSLTFTKSEFTVMALIKIILILAVIPYLLSVLIRDAIKYSSVCMLLKAWNGMCSGGWEYAKFIFDKKYSSLHWHIAAHPLTIFMIGSILKKEGKELDGDRLINISYQKDNSLSHIDFKSNNFNDISISSLKEDPFVNKYYTYSNWTNIRREWWIILLAIAMIVVIKLLS
jgi:hypothetical protein